MNAPMTRRKGDNLRKKKWARKNKSIRNLFAKLRNESSSSLDTINLDECKTPKKRKLSPIKDQPQPHGKLRKNNNSVIVINDEDTGTPQKCSTPIHSSTPLINKTNNISELNISKISRVQNNNSVVQNFNRDVENLTKEINRDSYLTIDLTTESINKTAENTVIDLNNVSESQDCILVSTNTSMSGDSDVTVLNRPTNTRSEERKILKFANGIASLDASSKGKLLELITQKIFSGCNVPKKLKDNLNVKQSRAVETEEDTYIKEVILGQCSSRNSIGSNIYNPTRNAKKSGLRMIVIDGSNVAMEHGKGRVFSVRGLHICINYFVQRGHTVKAFVPRFRCKFGKSTEPRLLDDLERRGLVVYTPSREIQGKMITSYDDRYIVQCAAEFDGVIVSGDNYRDLLQENPRWRRVIECRLLPFTWVQDMIMFPRDPLGRNGPTLEAFLRHGPESQ
ncbi:hypothetical protein MSG28_012799 [Choristoneura fumiferana]|uniref:Uncharacterized protein n=3 Tax=Choristoneura fumiferana TaxID=7141 RepID=A0ACC0JI37_CHOFU|nr:hypothetical protein MSG28_012799 [Choristoneura fumiferana]